MIRRVIKIDKEKCNGCGICVEACHEGAIGMVDGKATLMRDDYCDGLGDCLPTCPTGAISFEEREAAAFDAAAVAMKQKKAVKQPQQGSCPGSMAREIQRPAGGCPGSMPKHIQREAEPKATQAATLQSELMQWPVQIKLVPVNAPYFTGARLLIAADCTAFAYRNFHQDFIQGKITLIGCPKLDDGDYSDKLTEIIRSNDIKDVTVVRMEVPCCGGIENAVKQALIKSGKMIPWQVVTLSTGGEILDR